MSMLLDRIVELGAQLPEADAISFVDDQGCVVESMSRADVVADMARVSDFLRRDCGLMPGERALLVFPPGLDFVRGLVGCMAAGVVPVPVYTPDPINPHTSVEHLRRVAVDCAASVVLTNRGYADARDLGIAKSREAGRAVEWPAGLSWHVVPGSGDRGRCGSFQELSGWASGEDTPALLQYTSGSTSAPKGVVITYGNLAHQFEFNRRYLGLGLEARGVFWLPAYHDFGLISAILSTLWGNFELTLMSPLSFVKRPAVWFEVMDRVRATHTASPNFGYELAVRKTTAEQRASWDLSSLTMVMSAAEPVSPGTTRRFLEAFSAAGLRPEAFCPSFGLAEHSVGVTVWGRSSLRVDRAQLEARLAVPATGPDSKELMGCGPLTDDVDVRIVDPESCMELAAGQIGEIWADSPSKAVGYWGRPQESRAAFEAHLAGVDEGAGYLRTGDLGFVHDGELYVCGRVKDLLILAGRNIYPQDIEDSVFGCHRAIRAGGVAAFEIEANESEALALLVEVAADSSPELLSEVAAAVRAAVLKNHQLRCAVVVLGAPGAVSKTTSGKVQRARCRARLLDGSLDAQALMVDRCPDESPVADPSAPTLHEGQSRDLPTLVPGIPGRGAHNLEQLLAMVRGQVAALLGLGVADVDITQPLRDQGLNSIGITELASWLSQRLGTDVQPVDVFNYPTVQDLAQMLSRGEQHDDMQRSPHVGGRFAVIGAGCAGIAAAAQLIEQGAAEVVLFEANERVGGKVLSFTDEHGRVVELGQAGFSWKYQRSLRMVGRLGLELTASVPGLNSLRGGGEHQELDLTAELLEATDWSRQVMAAAEIEGPTTVAELCGRSDLGCGIDTWCREHNLSAAPLVWRQWWTGFGYGPFDDSTPAAYLVAFASLTDEIVDGPRTALAGLAVKGGNDQLWTAELQRLEATGRLQWRPSCPVRGLQVHDRGVVVQTHEQELGQLFDQVVVACPPWEARHLLPADDERAALLDRFNSYDYIVTLFTAEGLDLPDGYGIFAESEPLLDGRPLQLVVLGDDRFLVGQYGVGGDDAASIDAIRELTTALGGRFRDVVRRHHWPYFPRLTPADWNAGVLNALERAQGRDGIVLVGGYLSSELLEHVLVHAQATVVRHCGAPESAVDEPIAVVGMGCRAPGGVSDPDGLWALFDEGRDAIGPFPARWRSEGLYDSDRDAPGKSYAREGGFIEDAESFDAGFFGISPREAIAMDPQQRLVLEVAWEALERAGMNPDSLEKSLAGVYLGAQPSDYSVGTTSLDVFDGLRITGCASSVLSGRVAYVLGLQGPAMTVDTACSSSLTALHLAVSALRQRECDLALAGGVQVMSTPATVVEFSRLGAVAPDGRCKAFSEDADGAGWSEGCGILVLKRLCDAQRDGDSVLAVMRGSAVNQDGRSHGLTAPNGRSQQVVIRKALQASGLLPEDIDAVEAHGTGTALGDPIEAAALKEVFAPTRDGQRPLWLGSAKSNIGHSQAAAGVLGVMKMVLALVNERLPKTLHAQTPSEHIDWQTSGLALLQESRSWPRDPGRVRRAGVSSFGMSGTNAHLVLEEAPTPILHTPSQSASSPLVGVWPVSARTPEALAAQALRLHGYVTAHPSLDMADVASSLATTRSHHRYRAVITASADTADTRADVLEALEALGAGKAHPGVMQHHLQSPQAGAVVFVFPGQGAQYLGMGAELYTRHRGFADSVDACDAVLHPWTGWLVRDVLRQDPAAPSLDRVDVVQPVLFAVMVSLAAVLESYGVVPDAVIGHSQGEIAAAYVAGALSLADAAKTVALRSAALTRLAGRGAMASVLLSVDGVRQRLESFEGVLSVAAVNGPSHTVISGEALAVEQFVAACDRDGIQARSVAVDYASHCGQVEVLRGQLLEELADVSPRPSRVALYSTVESALSGQPLDTSAMDADYWYRNLREPVRFHDVVAALLAEGERVFVELSPHPVLAPAITDTLAGAARESSVVLPTLRRDQSDLDGLAAVLGRLHLHGRNLSWSALYPHACTVGLPTYPFERRSYWLAPSLAGDVSAAGLRGMEHPLLGAVAELAVSGQVVVSARLSTTLQGWLAGHRVRDVVVFPGAGFVDVVLAAGELAGCPVIDELVLHTPLVLGDAPCDVQIVVDGFDEVGRRGFSVHARLGEDDPGAGWTLHASGVVSADTPSVAVGLGTGGSGAGAAMDAESFYSGLAAHGYGYSGPFQGLSAMETDPADPDVVYARVQLPSDTDVDGYGIHPALLDAALHPLVGMSFGGGRDEGDRLAPRLPFVLSGICLHATAATCLDVRLTRIGADSYRLYATDPAGAAVISIDTVSLREIPDTLALNTPTTAPANDIYELSWPPLVADTSTPVAPPASVAVVTADPDRLPVGLREYPVYTELWAVTEPVPQRVIWVQPLPENLSEGTDPLPRLHALAGRMLGELQGWLARPDTADGELVVLTRHAVTTHVAGPAPDLAHAAVWALAHSAHSEHPHRIRMLDCDDSASTSDALSDVLACWPADEPQLALRDGTVQIPRVTPTRDDSTSLAPSIFDPEKTVLITGGTGKLGALIAEHLVVNHGVRHVLLASRRGLAAMGAAELQQRLRDLGASADISACDISDLGQLAALLDAIPDRQPLGAVIHAAGVLDDAVISELTGAQLDAVLAAKADTAWYLHDLTRGHNLDAFVLFSSAAGVLGAPGQANYAAANAVLDALALYRHRHQLPATSLAWGYWQSPDGMTAHLSSADQTRLTRSGLTPMTTAHGLALFDAALARQRPALVTSAFSVPALTAQARRNTLPAILSGLVRTRRQAATTIGPALLSTQLAAQAPQQQLDTLTALVTTATAAVLAHADPAGLDTGRPFKDLGIDSLTALELRNSLSAQTGLTLPASLIFDHPTPDAVAHHIHGRITGTAPHVVDTNADYVRRIQELIASTPASRLARAKVLDLLETVLLGDIDSAPDPQGKPFFADMSLDDLVAAALDNVKS